MAEDIQPLFFKPAKKIPIWKSARRSFFALATFALLGIWLLLEQSPKLVSLPIIQPQACDVIIVLGGEPHNRPKLAARLYNQGIASQVIVTGRGDGPVIAIKMVARGVPLDNIVLESLSASTYENAEKTAPILDSMHAQKVILVTSWFHAKRARACFLHFRPQMQFDVVSTPREQEWNYSTDRWAWQELLKTGVYWIRYGISPF